MNKYKSRATSKEQRNKYGQGWFLESQRHSLARRGIKTGRKVNYSYTPSDIPKIAVSGLGTAGSELVSWVPVGVTLGALTYTVKKGKKLKKQLGYVKALPIYKIKGKFYFLDMCLNEYRNIKDPSDRLSFDSVSSDDLQKPIAEDSKKIYGTDYAKESSKEDDLRELTSQAQREALESRKERIGFNKGVENEETGDITYSPTTVEMNEKIEEVESHPTLSEEEKRERIEKIKEKWREGLKKEFEISKKVVRGVGKVGKGFLSTVMTGLTFEPGEEKEEQRRRYVSPYRRFVMEEPDYAKKDWKETSKQSWKNKHKVVTILMPGYEISKNKYRYAVEVIGDFGYVSQHYIEKTKLMTKSQAIQFANEYMKKH